MKKNNLPSRIPCSGFAYVIWMGTPSYNSNSFQREGFFSISVAVMVLGISRVAVVMVGVPQVSFYNGLL
jgi:hypothetical protein